MKTNCAFLLFFVLAVLNFSCNNTNSAVPSLANTRPSLDVFVFIDKSQSVEFTQPQVLEKAKKQIAASLNLLSEPKDKLHIYYIHGNTGALSADNIQEIPEMIMPKNANTIERNNYKKAYVKIVKLQKKKMLDEVTSRLLLQNTSGTQKATDIIGALEVVSKNADPAHLKYIVILSDGVQTSKGLGNGSVKNTDAAVTLADKHLSTLNKNYSIRQSALKNTNAIMVLPYSSLSSQHNKYLNDYWEHLFNSFGVNIKFD